MSCIFPLHLIQHGIYKFAILHYVQIISALLILLPCREEKSKYDLLRGRAG
jgi:hypothetical protein